MFVEIIAAGYLRVSTDAQEDEGYSIPTQLTAIRQYCTQHGYTLVDDFVFQDTASGYTLDRPALKALREAAHGRRFTVFVCHAVDRLSRKQTHQAILLEEMLELGVQIEFVTEKFEDSATGRFLLGAKSFAAELEREKILERTMRGRQGKVALGKVLGQGSPPYGYTTEGTKADKRYIVTEPQAGVIRRIFEEYVFGRTIHQIADGLNRGMVPPPNPARSAQPRWMYQTIKKIMENSVYMGQPEAFRWRSVKSKAGKRSYRRRADSVKIAGGAPAIVEEAVFMAAQERLSNKSDVGRPVYDPERALLRGGFVRCACGASMALNGKYYVYGRRPNACTSININRLDAAVWEHVQAVLNQPEVVREQMRTEESDELCDAHLKAVDRALVSLTSQVQNLAANLSKVSGPAATILLDQLTSATEQSEALKKERQTLLSERAQREQAATRLRDLEEWCRALAGELHALDYAEKRLALSALGVNVTVHRPGQGPRAELQITFRLDGEVHARTERLVFLTTASSSSSDLHSLVVRRALQV